MAVVGAVEVARAYSVWARLEREFALGAGRARGGVLLPRHSLQQFRQFVRWLSADGRRRRCLADVRLAVGSYLDATRLTDWSHEVDSAIAGA